MTWLSGAVQQTAEFSDDLGDEASRQRLRTALAPGCDALGEIVRGAVERLAAIRSNGHPMAGGLLLAIDTFHAEECAQLLQRVTGERPVIVVSDDPDASRAIDRFRDGTAPWIVAVRMVSEGVDIPRLRVLVYATNILSELFFRQALGRIVRFTPGIEDQSAYFFIPRDPTLIGFASNVKRERDHQLKEELQREETSRDRAGTGQLSTFIPVAAEASAHDVIADGDVITQAEIADASAYAIEVGWRGPVEQIARILRKDRAKHGSLSVPQHVPPPPASVVPVHETKARAKKLLTRLTRQYAIAALGGDYKEVYRRLTERDGVYQDSVTLEQIQERIRVVTGWLEKLR